MYQKYKKDCQSIQTHINQYHDEMKTPKKKDEDRKRAHKKCIEMEADRIQCGDDM